MRGARPQAASRRAGATHYYTGPDGRDHLREAVGVIGDFLEDHLPS